MTDFASYPKAILHDHLDGGLRVGTVLELATEAGSERLPTTDANELARFFHQGESGSLAVYLQAFEHTVAVMQTAEALQRVAYEAVVDLAADGVVYAEIRFGPALHLTRGLALDEAVDAVAAGLRQGQAETGTVAGLILTALRQKPGSRAIAELAAASRSKGVVGFDLAGPEAGYPADDHLPACRTALEADLPLTIHAGESDGPNSIWRALQRCGARRIGHGFRIIEDTATVNGDITKLGRLAAYIRDMRVPLEICIASNLDTMGYEDPGHHPVGALHRAGFNVTLNTDNRLMSATSPAREFELAARYHGFEATDFLAVTEQALRAGFGDWPTRRRLLDEVVGPFYSELL